MSIQSNINQLLSIGAGISLANKQRKATEGINTSPKSEAATAKYNKSYESLKRQIEENRNVIAGMSERIEILKKRNPTQDNLTAIEDMRQSGLLSNRKAKNLAYKVKGGMSNGGDNI